MSLLGTYVWKVPKTYLSDHFPSFIRFYLVKIMTIDHTYRICLVLPIPYDRVLKRHFDLFLLNNPYTFFRRKLLHCANSDCVCKAFYFFSFLNMSFVRAHLKAVALSETTMEKEKKKQMRANRSPMYSI